MILAVDVDNTLLTEADGQVVLNLDVVMLMRAVYNLRLADIIVWSGGGADYATMVVRKYGLTQLVWMCAGKDMSMHGLRPDITVDDQVLTLGWVNLRIPDAGEPTPLMGIGT